MAGPKAEGRWPVAEAGGRWRWPLAGRRWPVAGGRWPVAGGRAEGRRPEAGGRWPVAGGRWPVAGGRWPVAGGRRPVAGGRWPEAGGRWPVAGGRWPVAGGRWPDIKKVYCGAFGLTGMAFTKPCACFLFSIFRFRWRNFNPNSASQMRCRFCGNSWLWVKRCFNLFDSFWGRLRKAGWVFIAAVVPIPRFRL